MLEVGTIPYPASFTSGTKSLISEFLFNNEFFFELIPINFILYRFTNCIADPTETLIVSQ